MSKQLNIVTLTGHEGIAPDILPVAIEVMRAAAGRHEVTLSFDEHIVGSGAIELGQEPLPETAIEACRRHGLVLKAPLRTLKGEGYRSLNVTLRCALELFANVRPINALPGVPCLQPKTNLIVLRENTEGLYSGEEFSAEQSPHRTAISTRVITEQACLRLLRFAFQLALRCPGPNGPPKVTLFHKANILKIGDGLFLEAAEEVAKEYEGRVAFNDWIIDAGACRMITHPGDFHVIVMENMFGDILSDAAAGLVGGLGIPSSVNVGNNCAMAEAVHGTWDAGGGKGIANPTPIILAAAMLFREIRLTEQASTVSPETGVLIANTIESAVFDLYRDRQLSELTGDVGGTASTIELGQAVMRRIAEQ